MKRFLSAALAYWFQEVPPHGLAAFRILFGTVVLCYLLSFFPHIGLLFSNEGVYSPVLVPDIAPSPFIAWLIYLAMIAAAVLFVGGYRTAWVTPLLLLLFVWHWCLNLAVKNVAYDWLIIICMFVCCFAQLDKVWAWSARAASTVPLVPAWPGRLLAFQLGALYFGSGLYKLIAVPSGFDAPPWHSGEMMRMTMLGPWGTNAAFSFVQLGWPDWIYTLTTWNVIVFELTAGFALCVPRLQKIFMVVGLLFHLSVWVFLNIPEFMVCPTVYAVFLEPREVRTAGEWLLAQLKNLD